MMMRIIWRNDISGCINGTEHFFFIYRLYIMTTDNEQLIINYYIVNFDVSHKKEYYDNPKNIENIKTMVFAKWKK